MPELPATRYLLAGGLILIILCGAAYCAVWHRSRPRENIFPHARRYRHVPWDWPDLLIIVASYMVVPGFAIIFLQSVNLLPRPADPTAPTLAEQKAVMTTAAFITPVSLAFGLGAMWFQSRTKLRHIGLSPWRWRPSLFLAFAMFVIVSPLVLGVSYLANNAMVWLGGAPAKHPLQQMLGPNASDLTWIMLTIQAVVIAPLVEEIVFRGVLMPWLSYRRWGGWAAMGVGVLIAFSVSNEHPWAPVIALGVSLLGVAVTLHRTGEQWAHRSIVGTSILFALTHAAVWPSPIPLLILGLALGWASHRTRSLIAPIVLHMLFNSVSTLLLLTGAASQ